MSQLPSADQSPQGAGSSSAPAAAPGFEAAVQAFWEKYRNLILVVCTAALLAIVAREGWQYFTAMRENGVREEYARIADRPDQLAAFAEAHAGHALAGVAWLRLADERFTAADYQPAATFYAKAAGSLSNEALLGRARLGAAISQLDSGDNAAGEAALKAISADPALLKGVRAEASYDLASLSAGAGRADDVRKLIDDISRIDPTSVWSQRAALLLVGPQAGGNPAATAAPTITFKPGN